MNLGESTDGLKVGQSGPFASSKNLATMYQLAAVPLQMVTNGSFDALRMRADDLLLLFAVQK